MQSKVFFIVFISVNTYFYTFVLFTKSLITNKIVEKRKLDPLQKVQKTTIYDVSATFSRVVQKNNIIELIQCQNDPVL